MALKVAKIPDNPYEEKTGAAKIIEAVPAKKPVTEAEKKELARMNLDYYLEHRDWKALPEEYKKALEKKSLDIYGQAGKAFRKRVEFIEKQGHLPSAGERVKVWHEEYLKAMVGTLATALKKDAEKRVDGIIAGFEGKDKTALEKQRASLVEFMANYIARNPEWAQKPVPLGEAEIKAEKAKTAENFLFVLLKGRDLPKEMKAELLGKADELDKKAKEKAEAMREYREPMLGRRLTTPEYVKIWQFEYKKLVLSELMEMNRGEAERRIEKTISSLGPELRGELEKDKEMHVKAMQYALATNPQLIRERKQGG